MRLSSARRTCTGRALPGFNQNGLVIVVSLAFLIASPLSNNPCAVANVLGAVAAPKRVYQLKALLKIEMPKPATKSVLCFKRLAGLFRPIFHQNVREKAKLREQFAFHGLERE
jgi:hypothetical protein